MHRSTFASAKTCQCPDQGVTFSKSCACCQPMASENHADYLRMMISRTGCVNVRVSDESAHSYLLVEIGDCEPRRVPYACIKRLGVLLSMAPRIGNGRAGMVPIDKLHDCFDDALLHATGRHRGVMQDGSASLLDIEIGRARLATKRRRERMRILETLYNPSTGHCCTSCASTEYNALCKKDERAAHWLCVLLLKRNEPDDVWLASAIQEMNWP